MHNYSIKKGKTRTYPSLPIVDFSATQHYCATIIVIIIRSTQRYPTMMMMMQTEESTGKKNDDGPLCVLCGARQQYIQCAAAASHNLTRFHFVKQSPKANRRSTSLLKNIIIPIQSLVWRIFATHVGPFGEPAMRKHILVNNYTQTEAHAVCICMYMLCGCLLWCIVFLVCEREKNERWFDGTRAITYETPTHRRSLSSSCSNMQDAHRNQQTSMECASRAIAPNAYRLCLREYGEQNLQLVYICVWVLSAMCIFLLCSVVATAVFRYTHVCEVCKCIYEYMGASGFWTLFKFIYIYIFGLFCVLNG